MSESPDRRGTSAPAAAPDPAPAQLPNSEVAAEMATNMLNSAISQKNAIADSFRAQRMAVLEAVVAQKSANLAPFAPRAPGQAASRASAAAVPADPAPSRTDQAAAGGVTAPPGEAPARPHPSPLEAAAEVGTQAPAAGGGDLAADPAQVAQSLLNSREFGALLSLLNSAGDTIDALLVARQIVEALKDLVAREVSTQLAARQKDQG